MMDADARTLKDACHRFETKYGIDAFLDTMASLMQDRLDAHGFKIDFFDEEVADHTHQSQEQRSSGHASSSGVKV